MKAGGGGGGGGEEDKTDLQVSPILHLFSSCQPIRPKSVQVHRPGSQPPSSSAPLAASRAVGNISSSDAHGTVRPRRRNAVAAAQATSPHHWRPVRSQRVPARLQRGQNMFMRASKGRSSSKSRQHEQEQEQAAGSRESRQQAAWGRGRGRSREQGAGAGAGADSRSRQQEQGAGASRLRAIEFCLPDQPLPPPPSRGLGELENLPAFPPSCPCINDHKDETLLSPFPPFLSPSPPFLSPPSLPASLRSRSVPLSHFAGDG
eukprot:765754-Hanusia_phi.AAC.2